MFKNKFIDHMFAFGYIIRRKEALDYKVYYSPNSLVTFINKLKQN